MSAQTVNANPGCLTLVYLIPFILAFYFHVAVIEMRLLRIAEAIEAGECAPAFGGAK